MADRLLLSEALDLIEKLLGAWPNGGREAGDGYIGALAAVLCDYPKMVAMECCSLRHGVARETKFLPTIADLVAFCERETKKIRDPLDREDRWDLLVTSQLEARKREDEERAKIPRPTLADLREKHGPNWGIKDPGAKHVPTPAEAREELIAQIGREAFDALPDKGWRTDDWENREKNEDPDWVKAEFPMHQFPPGKPAL